jgi:acyl-CoA synthetase (AMP-forming)/AMP-acid ligase II
MSDTPVNIASVLPARAAAQPDVPAIHYPVGRDRDGRTRYIHYTYRELDEESTILAAGLQASGIGPGVRTVLMVRPSLPFFALTFAIFRAGAVPVFVDPGMGLRNLGTCLAEAAPEAFIGIPQAHAARVVLGWARPTLRTLVTVGPRLGWGGITLAQVRARGLAARAGWTPPPTRAEDMAAILFTSGSTGVPKGVVYTHGIFLAQVESIRSLYDIQPGEIDLPTFPLFALFDPALGMTTVIPRMDFTRPAKVDPRNIAEAVEQFGVTTLFGSPALLRTVGRWGVRHGVQLPTLRRVISAGAPVSPQVLETFAAMLPDDARIHTPYGATESLPVATIHHRQILDDTRAATEAGRGVCVGLPAPGMQVEVIRIDDGPLPDWSDDLPVPRGEVGEIVVRGPVVSTTYYQREASTVLAKIRAADGGILHRMGDLGYFDDQGRLWFCGRKAHRVILPDGRILFTIQVEQVFNVHPQVARTALVGARGPDGATLPVLCIEREEELPDGETRRLTHAALCETLRTLAQTHAHTRDIRHMLIHPAFPVDIRHNAKIGREQLAAWATQELARGKG